MSTSLLEGAGTPAPEPTAPVIEPIAPAAPTVSLPEFMKDWKLDPEIAREEALLNFKDPSDLVKSYVHAKKFVGADKIKVPTSHTTDEEWKQIYSKLGLPDTVDKYKVDLPEGKLDKGFIDKFILSAHGAGILPAQAQNIIKFYNGEIEEQIKTMEAEQKVNIEKNQKELKDAFGEALPDKLNKARFAMKELGGDTAEQYLKDAGLLADAKVIMMFAKAGEALSGDSIPGVKQTSSTALTPEQAAMRMDDIRSEMIQINDPSNPKYMNLQKEQERIAKFAYPDQMGVAPADGE